MYGVEMPPYYKRIMRDAFAWIDFDWTQALVPGECLWGGFATRLALRGLVPFGVIVAIVLVSMAIVAIQQLLTNRKERLRQQGRREGERDLAAGRQGALLRGALNAMPLVLFFSFCIVPGVSAGVFKAWSCATYIDDDVGEVVTRQSFLRADLKVDLDYACTRLRGSGRAACGRVGGCLRLRVGAGVLVHVP